MRSHLFPFRTEKLSSLTPMVLRFSRGRVGSRLFKVRSKGLTFFCACTFAVSSWKTIADPSGRDEAAVFISYIFCETRSGCMSTRRYSCGRRVGAMKCDGIWSSAVSIITIHSVWTGGYSCCLPRCRTIRTKGLGRQMQGATRLPLSEKVGPVRTSGWFCSACVSRTRAAVWRKYWLWQGRNWCRLAVDSYS